MIRLSLASMKKMRELGHPISHLIFIRLIILHSSPNHRKAISRILRQMRADKVHPHVSTYNILMKIKANQHNIEGLVEVFGDMKRAQVEPKEIFFCILATAHAVARLYTVCEAYVEAVEKSATGNNWSTLDVLILSKSFVVAIEAFGRMGGLSHAEQLWLEMKSKKGLKSTKQFNSMISVYSRLGFITKATKPYEEMEQNGCKPNAITY
ncbi:hypothetical protein TEA_016568 [Camellia sinensis var. sinensis]|uniref:Pentacotripeptide-repeat region of PRORP domain-containing protein n=1 Tax=Camellia sinensis var. sinensis TaxID=542762 RepID=A0A4S4D9P5_CAMSN|nr:hypothetical protein TEA_016568 [Camellia sinensis var. sinensis]